MKWRKGREGNNEREIKESKGRLEGEKKLIKGDCKRWSSAKGRLYEETVNKKEKGEKREIKREIKVRKGD